MARDTGGRKRLKTTVVSPLVAGETPLLIVLSGPSGAGKDALLRRIKELQQPYHVTVTVTTRKIRDGEHDGQDYYFVSLERFQQMIRNGELLEWAKVYGNYYGVPRAQVKEALEQGKDTIIKADVQGAATIKELLPDAVFIFLAPVSFEELAQRLRQRHSESDHDLKLRLESAGEEMERLPMFDYFLVSRTGDLDYTLRCFEAVVTAEKRRVVPRRVAL